MAGGLSGHSPRSMAPTTTGQAGVRKQALSLYLNINTRNVQHTCFSRSLRLLIVWMSLMSYCSAASTSPTEPPERQEKVCKDIDIRNRVNFSKLENCTVIEGSLQILLIDYADPSEYENLHFPHLLEITDYLLLYRVYGLKTLAHIFPNLTVIRGQKLFFNYALVAFEMPDIEELGLPGLTHILRGAVRLEKNAKLCYVHTVDWGRIARNVSKEDHFISQNKDMDECVDTCPKNPITQRDLCHKVPVLNEDGINRTRAVCWTAHRCQKVCPMKCESGCYFSHVTKQDECCNEHCIGGCRGPKATQCFACKHVLGVNGRCEPRCTGTYRYMNRRCILQKDCENLKTTGYYQMTTQWKLHQNECIKDCPSGYSEEGKLCVKCQGPCPKVCMAKVVDSVATAQELKGCTVIEGILEIQIRGGNRVMQELEENLGLIQSVPAIKIVRSVAIYSLRFLKNLKMITGETLFSDRYSLFVLDNQNLQEIWDLKTHPKLQLIQGNLFFHRNHKLCHYKIKEFVHSLGLDREDQDISPVTNGDQMPCNISQIQINVTQVKVNFAVVKWSAFEMNDNRQLLSYVIYYKESPFRNQTIFNAKDSCGLEDWQTYDVRPVSGSDLAELVYDLKPWTQYAMYIQTYTLSSTSEGGVSPIIYFTTQATTPTHPRDVMVKAISPTELKVTWLPPNKPNGNVTHYQVYWQPQPLNRKKLDKRNYCRDKLHLAWKNRQSQVEAKKEAARNRTVNSGQCCKCPKTEEEKQQEEEERRMEIEFQNFLQDTVYVKRPPKNGQSKADSGGAAGGSTQIKRRRRRRSLSGSKVQKLMQNLGLNASYWPEGLNMSSLSNMSMVNESEGPDEEHVPYLAAVVYGKVEMILPNLRHFQEYSIEVIACHDPQTNAKTEKQCSNRAITTGRTLPLNTADNVSPQNVSANVEQDGRVRIKWIDPPEPNGLIVTYEIEYGKVSHEHYKRDVLCIPHLKFRKYNGYIMGEKKLLQPGNYSFRIRATSLAGNGTWTPQAFFFLPDRYDEPSIRDLLVIVIPVAVFIFIFLVVGLGSVYVVYKKRAQALLPGVLYASVNPHYMSPDDVYIPDKWEVPRDKIKMIRELGQGSFGMVHEGCAKDLLKGEANTRVAIKTVNENATIRDRIEFLQEASVMKAFNCDHVVKLLGVVSKGQPTMVIMELMASGDLKNFLRMHRPTEEDNNGRKPPTLKQILQMAGEIADGMAYLCAMKFVHRDLAARNCMVSEETIVKVGDFGMTRDIYETDYYRKGGKGLLPVRWMAPESLKDGIFTSQSDVWSFGVVLWEMATLAFQPYQGLANEQVLKYVIDGGVMQQPYGCPERLYNLMLLCWRHHDKVRPTFVEIVESLAEDLNEDFRQKSYFYSEERMEKERDQEEKERDAAEKAQAEMVAMAAAKANAIGPEEFGMQEEEDDMTTPLTGSPRYGSQDLTDIDIDVDNRQSFESLCSACSHRRPACQCIDIDTSAKAKPGPSSGSPQRRPYMGAVLPISDHLTERGDPPGPGLSTPSSGEGSKESSKSSGSSHLRLNGMSNGHLPRSRPYLGQHKYHAEC